MVGAFLQGASQLGLERRSYQPLPGIHDRRAQLRSEEPAGPRDHSGDHRPHDAVVGQSDPRPQDLLGLAPQDGQDAVRHRYLQGLPVAVVGVELRRRSLLARRALGLAGARELGEPARHRPQPGVFGDPLGTDVARAGERGRDVGDLCVRPHERRDEVLETSAGGRLLGPEQVRQGLQTTGSRDAGARLSLGPVRQVEIFELDTRLGGGDGRSQRGSHLPLLVDGPDDGRAPRVELRERRRAIEDGLDGHLVEPAGRLLAVARQKRNGGAFGRERQGGHDLRGGDAQLAGDLEGALLRQRPGHDRGL